jgi:peptidoglycan lytic transglycosylase
MTLPIFSRNHQLTRWIRPNHIIAIGVSLLVSACMSPNGSKDNRPDLSKKVVNYGQKVPKGGGRYKIGKPYQIANKWYRPRENTRYDRVGMASWYGDLFHGRKTANGEVFNMDALTAAHPTLPLPTLVEVTNLANNRTVIVRVNDRGPYRHNRLIDLSRKAATVLGFKKNGTAKVRVRYVGRAPLNGDDRYEKRVLASKARARKYNARRRASIQRSTAPGQAYGVQSYSQSYGDFTASTDYGYEDRNGLSFSGYEQ